jgi:hypothetical protein
MPAPGNGARRCGKREQDENRCGKPAGLLLLASPCLQERGGPDDFDRQRAEHLNPEEWVEPARAACGQLARIQRMASLRHPLAQLVDMHQEHAGLLQRALDFGQRGGELLALLGDLGRFGWLLLFRRKAKLLEALL